MIDNIKPPRRAGQQRAAATGAERESSVSLPVFENIERKPPVDNPLINLPRVVRTAPIQKQQPPPSRFKRLIRSPSKKQWAMIAALVLISIGSVTAWKAHSYTMPQTDDWRPDVSMYKKKEPPKPVTEASRLTGVQISPELNKNPVTGVMIENSPDARPQSGLMEAGVVFEALSEGGITRFLALYLETSPEHIGPVRSVRPYFLDFLKPFDAPIAHVGGSAEALQQIATQNIKDLDQMRNPGVYARRHHRYAPHNMYTSRQGLLDLHKQKGFTESTFSGFPRQEEKKGETPNAAIVEANPSSALYSVRYEYNPEGNDYKRFMGGKPHTDEQTGTQLRPKVVVVLVVPHSYAGIYSVYQVNGSGKAYIFQNGMVTEGIWEKRSRSDQYRFGDKNGAPLALNPGQTWITLVGQPDMVSFR